MNVGRISQIGLSYSYHGYQKLQTGMSTLSPYHESPFIAISGLNCSPLWHWPLRYSEEYLYTLLAKFKLQDITRKHSEVIQHHGRTWLSIFDDVSSTLWSCTTDDCDTRTLWLITDAILAASGDGGKMPILGNGAAVPCELTTAVFALLQSAAAVTDVAAVVLFQLAATSR